MKILLAVDGSGVSLEAARFVLRLASGGLQIEVVLVNVQEPANLYELIVAHNPALIEQVSHDAGMHLLAPARGLLQAGGLDIDSQVGSGDPAHTIVDIAERFGCEMIVMGARGNSALRSALMGSVSNEVLHASAVPVVIVKAGEEDSLA